LPEPLTPAPTGNSAAKFTRGSTLRHVVVMTGTGSVGLMAIFLVDFANLFYISLLGKETLAAAIGYAGTILFFTISSSIGITIATAALVSRAIGAGDHKRARRLAMSCMVFMVVFTVLAAAVLIATMGPVLSLLGASGQTHKIASTFLLIVLPSMPLMGLGMALSSLLRAVGDAKRAMFVTLASGIVSAILDPILIFGLDMGIEGAAWATVLSRFALVGVSIRGAVVIHRLVAPLHLGQALEDFRTIAAIAVPAVLTNVATPIGNAYLTAAIAPYGDSAVAGWAIIGRLIPVVFGGIFALSGSVGPILGQNYGARQLDRVRRTVIDALIFMAIYVFVMCSVLILTRHVIIEAFSAVGQGAALIDFFCLFIAASFLFSGALFVSNAAFNSLGRPLLSTVFNWGRSTLGTIPLAWAGSQIAGAQGVLAGWGIGAVVFGIAAILTCFLVIRNLPEDPDNDRPPPVWRMALSAFTSAKGAAAG
jgi:putative MATE family efflux protein